MRLQELLFGLIFLNIYKCIYIPSAQWLLKKHIKTEKMCLDVTDTSRNKTTTKHQVY
jgi:hypothetical protein